LRHGEGISRLFTRQQSTEIQAAYLTRGS
jgi:hypothetical protein